MLDKFASAVIPNDPESRPRLPRVRSRRAGDVRANHRIRHPEPRLRGRDLRAT